jgi:N-acetylmuramoyl-L-alanine amidase
MKKVLVFLTVFCMMMSMLADTVAASYSSKKPPLSLQILGKTVTPAPILYKNTVLLPLRAMGKALGYQVNYSTASKTMDLVTKNSTITVTVGYTNAKVNGAVVKMDIAPVLSNDTVYVPMTFIQKSLDYSTSFSADKNMAIIDKKTAAKPPDNTGTTKPATPTTPTGTAASNSMTVLGKKIAATSKPIVKSNIVYVPMRVVGEALGYKVTWTASTKRMNMAKDKQSLNVVEGKTAADWNKRAIKLDAAPFLSSGNLYAPLTLFSKSLGYEAAYDSKLGSLAINKKEATKPQENPPVTNVPVNTPPGVAKITNIMYNDDVGFPEVKIYADGELSAYSTYTMVNPNRLVIDIPSTVVGTEFVSKDIKKEGISSVRIGQLNSEPAITRVVLDLDSEKPCKVVQAADKKSISVLYANVITPIAYQKEDDKDILVVSGTSALDTRVMELSSPRRLVVDVNKAVFDNLLQSMPATSNLIKLVRIGQYEEDIARVVLEIADDAYYKVDTSGKTAKIYLSSIPFTFAQYARNYNTSVLNLNPGKEVSYDVSVDEAASTVNVVIPQDLKLDAKRIDINDNLVESIDYRTEVQNGSKVTVASIKTQPSIQSSVISDASAKLIKIGFKRKITNIQQLTVVIDGGHGGKDPGAGGTDGTTEKSLNLEVALRLDKLLKSVGMNTILTRQNDTFIELGERANIANRNYADFFVSIHFNSFNKTTNGIETLYYPNTPNKDYTINHKSIAQIFHTELLSSTKLASRAITARPNLVVLNKTKMPAILAELGFVSNPTELAVIKTDKYKEDAARALAVSILKYFRDMEGANIEIDPNSIYSLPYQQETANATTAVQPMAAETPADQPVTPEEQEAVLQP